MEVGPPPGFTARGHTPRRRLFFFTITFFKRISHVLNSEVRFACPMRTHRQRGLAIRSRVLTHPRIRGLCHWGGEPAGHLGADSPSRRATEHASAKRTKPPCPHWLRGLSQTHHVNAVSRHRRVPPFASSRRPLTHALAHLQWQEPPRFIDASATSRASIKEPSPSRGPTTRPLRASPRHP